ncbi:MAG: hypothetical protein ACOCRK_10350 [bacterium]
MNIFETASKKKFRFNFRGIISTEDLWDLSLEQLDFIFKDLNSQLKETQEESLMETKSKAESDLETKIKIVKHVFDAKLKAKEAREKAAETKAKKQRIMEIINKKKEENLENKEIEELQEMLNELED